MNLEEGKMFIRNAENFISLFGGKAFEEALEEFDVTDFSTVEYVPADHVGTIQYYERQGYPMLNASIRHCVREEHYCKGHVWERYVDKVCMEFRVRCQHQLNESKLLRHLLETQFPYLKLFNLRIYHLNAPDSDIYVECESGFLYVPVRAIITGNWQMILERHNTYHRGYYNTPDRAEYLAKALAIPEDYTARLLRACMEVEK